MEDSLPPKPPIDIPSVFSLARNVSRLWLPSWLENLVALLPALCDADGCSLFLKLGKSLHLAATTRQNLKSRLFDPEVSYTADRQLLAEAARYFDRHGKIHLDASLTGWAAAFDEVLNLKDLRDIGEREQIARELGQPLPVWSDKLRGHFDSEGPKPFLAVPMRGRATREVFGVIRAYSIRPNPRPFSIEHVNRLVEFGASIADFLDSNQLLAPGIEETFRIWTAQDANEFMRRLTSVIPRLFQVDCCSFFARDVADRFVLRYAGANQLLDPEDRSHFERFLAENRDRLFYDDKIESKTGLCIKTQRALGLLHDEARQWTIMGDSDFCAESALREESSPQFLDGRQSRPNCELDHQRSRCILLVPVRDAISPRKLSGVLRVVSTSKESATDRNLAELQQFAAALAERFGHTNRVSVEQTACQRLVDQLGKFPESSNDSNWRMAAQIAAEALSADAVTIFLSNGRKLTSKRDYSYLNEPQIRVDHPVDFLESAKEKHTFFRTVVLPNLVYEIGQGATGWAATNRRVLNLRYVFDRSELDSYGIKHPFDKTCELHEAGPFIAAPISLGPGAMIDGVIRAVRFCDSPHGPFSVYHELILSTFTTMLAGVCRVWRHTSESKVAAPRRVVVSYSDAKLKDEVCRFLSALGVEPLDLGHTPAGPYPNPRFEELIAKAGAALVIATPVANAAYISSNVESEVGQLRQAIPGRILLLQDRDARVSTMARDIQSTEFDRALGISSTFTDIALKVKEWFPVL